MTDARFVHFKWAIHSFDKVFICAASNLLLCVVVSSAVLPIFCLYTEVGNSPVQVC